MQTSAVILKGPKDLGLDVLDVKPPTADDLVVRISHSGISTGTEKLFWSGEMPPFPGMGYPLVPGYEAVGEVMQASPSCDFKAGDRVFVPGANCYEGAFGLFGGAARTLVTDPARVTKIDAGFDADDRRDYTSIYDASGSAAILPDLIGRIQKGGEIVLAGFYTDPISFAFPPAFMKEARLRVSAEWTGDDLTATRALVESGALSLGGLITHTSNAATAATAYNTAFTDPSCLKMILDWEDHA